MIRPPPMVGILSHYLEHFTYVGLFLALLACGVGFPWPEEIVMVIGGFLVYRGSTELPQTLVVGLAGAIGGDAIIYHLGRRWGKSATQKSEYRRIFSAQGIAWMEEFFKKHGKKTIFIARFLSGFRSAACLVAGISKMDRARFFAIDTLAGLFYVPLFMGLGWYLGDNLQTAVGVAHRLKRLALVAVPFLVLFFFLYALRQRRKVRLLP